MKEVADFIQTHCEEAEDGEMVLRVSVIDREHGLRPGSTLKALKKNRSVIRNPLLCVDVLGEKALTDSGYCFLVFLGELPGKLARRHRILVAQYILKMSEIQNMALEAERKMKSDNGFYGGSKDFIMVY